MAAAAAQAALMNDWPVCLAVRTLGDR